MFWVPCVRVDIPVDAPRPELRRVGTALDTLVTTLEVTHVLRLNLALSAAALTAFEREGFLPLIDRIAELAADRRIDLIATPAHDAILPLVPRDEALRQLDLTHRINQRFFGDSWHPSTLWPPALAFSYKVAELAQERDYSCILVDEAAMRVAGRWPGNRIDCIDKMPGMFLLPCAREVSRALAKGEITRDAELAKFVEGGVEANRYVVTAIDLAAQSVRLALFATDTVRSARVEQVFSVFSLEKATSPLPCSEDSTPEELSDGVPFGRWFAPGNEPQALRWRLMTLCADALREAESRRIMAAPELVALRAAVDRGWRASYWLDPKHGLEPLRDAYEKAHGLLEARLATEIGRALDRCTT